VRLTCLLLPPRWGEGRVKPNGRLVRVSSARCRVYTSRLSTWSSSRGLRGDLILGQVIGFPALLTAGMHRTEHRNRERRTPRLSAPRQPISSAAGLTLR
jgi:hypothetical protein